jgi:kumamolisin
MGKSVGFLNPTIYAQAVEASGFHDITQGNNGSFSAAQGWDACTGLGTPNGAQLLAALTGTISGPTSVGKRATGSKKPAA